LNVPGAILVGLPGVGKSTAGRQAAEKLHRSFCDTDDALRERYGVSSADMLRTVGVEVFRERECGLLRDLIDSSGVISTGGGIVTTVAARELLRATGRVIWLDSPPLLLRERVEAGDRPLLGDDVAQRLIELDAERRPLYQDVASAVVDATRPIRDVVSLIVEIVGEWESCA